MYALNIQPENLTYTIEPLSCEYNTTDLIRFLNAPPVSFASNLTRSSEVIYQILRNLIEQHQQAWIIIALLVLYLIVSLTIVLRYCCFGRRTKSHTIQSYETGTFLSFNHDDESGCLSVTLVGTTTYQTVRPDATPLINNVHVSTVNETVRPEDDTVSPQWKIILSRMAVTSIYRPCPCMDTLIFRRTHKHVRRQHAVDALLPRAAAKQPSQST